MSSDDIQLAEPPPEPKSEVGLALFAFFASACFIFTGFALAFITPIGGFTTGGLGLLMAVGTFIGVARSCSSP